MANLVFCKSAITYDKRQWGTLTTKAEQILTGVLSLYAFHLQNLEVIFCIRFCVSECSVFIYWQHSQWCTVILRYDASSHMVPAHLICSVPLANLKTVLMDNSNRMLVTVAVAQHASNTLVSATIFQLYVAVKLHCLQPMQNRVGKLFRISWGARKGIPKFR